MENIRTRVVRFTDQTGQIHIGLDEGEVIKRLPGEWRIADLLRVRVDTMREMVATASAEIPAESVRLLAPLDGLTEVWAAGVTYSRSRDARVEETTEPTVYDRIYEAERPELFFKAPAWRVVTDGQPIAVREDSAINVPEPELGLVINAFGEIAGYVVVNDVSSRSIEGDNPLYLPQAKIYAGSCSVSSGIVPVWLTDIAALEIGMWVYRAGAVVFEGRTSTSSFHRPAAGLVPYLTSFMRFPDGVVLSTGTGIVPELDFNLAPGDTVEIRIENVGSLTNTVLRTAEWLDSVGS
ncbi:fumarylacetoacetate hydrolase family protein [Kibdelosporangium philippinense]|uniref:Fumarylacetoacetate hydrolase family protein n=1 Tax=Kibdelosporangium philippinense TaxID=211113 RepID=A0ABS8ZDM8_9PSEU|nr:fumarylacetoacetate hydrolase family protein [Kibdelosporangium philippinense]MCE7005557.1 fumarylacetoacetate hydrolase family protein [Kibdelosporangium philippinense]